MAQAEHVVTVHGPVTGMRQTILSGKHELVSDEPPGNGGTDTGPAPYDLLLAALGACTSMTVSMYARRHAIPLDAVTVRLKHRKLPAPEGTGKLDHIEREIELSGALGDAQREKLLEIANKCPVHRTLSQLPRIETTLWDPEDAP